MELNLTKLDAAEKLIHDWLLENMNDDEVHTDVIRVELSLSLAIDRLRKIT